MSISRFSVLAVFLMMVLSTFVGIPMNQVGAASGNENIDVTSVTSVSDGSGHINWTVNWDARDLMANSSYTMVTKVSEFLHGYTIFTEWHNFSVPSDFTIFSGNSSFLTEENVCYDYDLILYEYDNEQDNYLHLTDVLTKLGNCDDNDNHDDYYEDERRDPVPVENSMSIEMEDLENWKLYATSTFNESDSEQIRNRYAEDCEHMGFVDEATEVTQDCFDYIQYIENSPGECGDGLSTDVEICKELEACYDSSDDFDLNCMKTLYDVCSDNTSWHLGEHSSCNDEDDDVEVWFKLFDYENNLMTSTEWADYISEVILEESDSDDDDDDYHSIATYDTYNFTVVNTDSYGITLETPHNFNEITFVCGNGSDTIPFDYVNDEESDCDDGSDEQWYDNNTPEDVTDDCQLHNSWNSTCEGEPVNWFDCHDNSKVWINEVNNGVWNCPDGEDEPKGGDWWMNADAYLFSESFDPTNIDNLLAVESRVCDWEDPAYPEYGIDCNDMISIDLVPGDYTLVTASRCNMFWNDTTDDYDPACNSDEWSRNYGQYIYQIETASNGNVDKVHGNISESAPTMPRYYAYEGMEASSNKDHFPLYKTKSIEVGPDGFDGKILSKHIECSYHDWEDVTHCYGASGVATYLYEEEFDSSNTTKNLLYSNDYHTPSDIWGMDHSNDNRHTMLDIKLDQGDYVVVTTLNQYYMSSDSEYSYSYEMISDGEELPITDWSGIFEHDNFDRAYMPHSWEHDPRYAANNAFWDEFDDWSDEKIHGMEKIVGDYQNGTITADNAASSLAVSLREYAEEAMEMMEEIDYGYDYDDSDCYFDDLDCYDMRYICVLGSEDFDSEDCAHRLYDYCEDNGSEACDRVAEACENGDIEEEICNKFVDERNENSLSLDGVFSSYLDVEPEIQGIVGVVENNPNAVYFMIQEVVNFEGIDSSLSSHTLILPGDDSDEEEHEDHSHGVEDNTHDHNEEDEDLPFNVRVKVADGYQIDELVSLSGIDYVKDSDSEISFVLSESDQVHDVIITFSKIPEPEVLPDCDVTIGIDDANYAFNPVSVEIDFGQTVCWQWTNSTEPHNVAQVAESSDTTKLSSGFYSGAANVSGDFRVTFDAAGGYSDDTTYYYICEPHATMGMVGEVVVGTGSTDPELEEALEESGIPSVSFIVGILVLVGAAGLRRRIH